MKFSYIFIIGIFSGYLFLSCEEDTDINTSDNIQLSFSVDSLFFDTLISGIPSPFQRIRVKNVNSFGVVINEVRVVGNDKSLLALWYKGNLASPLHDLIINAQDSALFLVQLRLENTEENAISALELAVEFEWSNQIKTIPVEVYRQNVTFVSRRIWCDTILTSLRPVVIQDTVLVDSACQLSIKAGTQIIFAPGAALFIGGTLHVEGDSSAQVIFTNSRKDANYKIAPGQWKGIFFLTSSRNNEIRYSIIENAEIGVYVGIPDTDSTVDLTIENSIIRHHSFSALQAFNSDIFMQNTLLYDAGQNVMFHAIGGNYQYEHCSIINRPSSFFSSEETVIFSDNLVQKNTLLTAPLHISMKHCVVWDPGREGMLISESSPLLNQLDIRQNLIWGTLNLPDNYWTIQIEQKLFFNENNYNYSPDSLSFLRDRAIESVQTVDLFGRRRVQIPDLGAIEYVENP